MASLRHNQIAADRECLLLRINGEGCGCLAVFLSAQETVLDVVAGRRELLLDEFRYVFLEVGQDAVDDRFRFDRLGSGCDDRIEGLFFARIS
jgi:hypothetical protein